MEEPVAIAPLKEVEGVTRAPLKAEAALDFKGKPWKQVAQESTDRELLAIIRSTNPNGAYALGRVAAMDEWDRRHPVGAERMPAPSEAEENE